MNNYLTSIAARTLSPAPSVRPRLGGRFEPLSGFTEGSIASAKSSRHTTAKHSQPDSQREQLGAIETAEQRDSNDQAEKSFALTAHLERPAAPTPEVNSGAATASRVTGSVVDPAPSLTIRAPHQQTMAGSPRQNVSVAVRPVEKVIEVVESAEFLSKTPPESRRKNWPEPRFEESPDRSARVHHQPAEEVEPPSFRALKSSASVDDDQEPVVRPPTVRKKPLVERELETIVIREKTVADESALNGASTKSLPTPAVTSDASENGVSKTPLVVVQSSIAPLIETGPEQVQLNRPDAQPQPTVHVTIGRIEVRAVQSSQSPARSRAATPVMNLDDYLKRRSEGGAR